MSFFRRAWIYDSSEEAFEDMVQYNSDPSTAVIPFRTPKVKTDGTANTFLRDWLTPMLRNGHKFGSLVFITHGEPGVLKTDQRRLYGTNIESLFGNRGLEKLLVGPGRVYFAGCNVAADEVGWQLLKFAAKVFLRGGVRSEQSRSPLVVQQLLG